MKQRCDSLVLFFLGLSLYSLTLAPTVLWGDEGYWQLQAVTGHLQASAGGHPLWVLIAHLFSRIPFGDLAGRVNFVSALFGAVSLALTYRVAREAGTHRWPAIMATLALMVSHTFWSYAVRAEVYTFTFAVMALLAWMGLRWYNTGRPVYLLGGWFLLGLGLAVHLMVVLYVPGLLFLMWKKRTELDVKKLLLLLLAWGAGAAPLIGLLWRDVQTYGMDAKQALEWALFSFEGYNFRAALLDFSLRDFGSDCFQWLAFLVLNFAGLAVVYGIGGAFKSREILGRDKALYFFLLYGGVWVFAFPYRVGDRYVFYLPGYLPFAVWLASGLQGWEPRLDRRAGGAKSRWWWRFLLIGLLIAVPITAYRIAPELVERGITFRDSRHVPGPGGKYFFLWPPKNGYYDPRLYAEAVLNAVPEGTFFLAEPALVSPIRFLQVVEGRRPDVTLRYCCWDIQSALTGAKGRPVAIADVYPGVYPVEWIRQYYRVIPYGPVYLLQPLD